MPAGTSNLVTLTSIARCVQALLANATVAVTTTGAVTVGTAGAALAMLAGFVGLARYLDRKDQAKHEEINQLLHRVLGAQSISDDEIQGQLTVMKFDTDLDHEEVCNRLSAIRDMIAAGRDNTKQIEAILEKHEGLFVSFERFFLDNFQELRTALGEQLDGVTDSINDIKTILHREPPLYIHRARRDGSDLRLNPYLYSYREVPFVGRERELDRLEAFLKCHKKFAWWLVTGSGGLGKSRLALEFCRSTDEAWYTGFLSDGQASNFNWHDWQPTRPALIVIDYAARDAADVGDMLKKLTTRCETGQLEQPVRVLLLERYSMAQKKEPRTERSTTSPSTDDRSGMMRQMEATMQTLPEASWWKDLLGSGTRRDAILRAQFRFRDESGNGASVEDELALSELDDDGCWSIIQHCAPDLDDPQRDDVLNQFKRIDPERRPLFANFLGRAIADGKPYRDWNRKDLTRFVLQREREHFWNPDGVTDLDENLLALATILGGIDHEKGGESLLKPLADEKLIPAGPDFDRYAVMTGRPPEETRLHPLEPDLLGELFVADRLLTEADGWGGRGTLSPLVLKACVERSNDALLFFVRLCTDLEDDDRIPRFLQLLATQEETASFCLSLRYALAYIASIRRHTDHEIEHLTAIIDMPDAPAEQRAKAYNNRGVAYGRRGRDGDIERELADYTAVIEMPDAPAEQRAKAYNNRGVAYGRRGSDGDIELELADYNAVIDMPDAPAEQRAMAYNNRGVAYGRRSSDGDIELELADYTAVIEMPDAPAEHRAKAYNNRGVTYGQRGRDGDTERAISDFTAVIDMPDAPAEQRAKAYNNRGVTYGQRGSDGDIESAISDFTAVIEMPDAPPTLRVRAMATRVTVFVHTGRRAEACRDLHALRDIAQQSNATELLQQIETLIAEHCSDQ